MKAAPILKWAGGKRALLPQILPRIPNNIRTYYEPFSGGLAVFFALANAGRFVSAVIGDANPCLVNLYTQLRDRCLRVNILLAGHTVAHSKEHFYAQREIGALGDGEEGAARLIYLNRTCFNGLYRVNKAGVFNVPFGSYDSPKIYDPDALYAASTALQGVEIVKADFARQIIGASAGDFVYMDPPYVPMTTSANFTAYSKDGFTLADQERVESAAFDAVTRGAGVLISNSDTTETRRIFSSVGWRVDSVSVRRNINCKGAKRGAVGEILVSAT